MHWRTNERGLHRTYYWYAFFDYCSTFRYSNSFLTKESMLHVSEGTQDGNNCYLGYNSDLRRSVNCYAAYCGTDIVAYAMVLKNDPKHLVRLYTTPGFRCLGLGTAFLFGLDIWSLGCLRENRSALALYKRLGFEPVDESSVVMTLKRTK